MASTECINSKHINHILYLSSVKAQDSTYDTSTQYSCFEQEIDTLEELCDASQMDMFLLL